MALLNGQFDLAMRLIERGADPDLRTETDGISPLFAVLQTQWALRFTDHPQPRAQLMLDVGAVGVLCKGGRSLRPVGVRAVSGNFRRGEMVSCTDERGREVARGLINYDADEARAIAGRSSDRIAEVLGYISDEEMIHRDNLVIV